MNDCCKTCNYCCNVRKYPDYQEELTKICVLHLLQDGRAYIIEVADNDRCECYMEYKE